MALARLEFRSSYSRKNVLVQINADGEYIMGSDGSNNIVLEGIGVRGQHARLIAAGTGFLLAPMEDTPVAVNGHSIEGPTRLEDGDWMALDKTLFQIRILDSQERQRTEPVSPAKTSSVGRDKDGIVVTIGRLPGCDIEIGSPMVSREHAQLLWRSGGWVLEDLHSTNGTFVNGQRLVGNTLLHKGDRIAIATFAFLFTGDALQPLDMEGRVRIEASNLCKNVTDRSTRQPKRLLDQIDLVIESGEFVAIFGTSGSGKSTLLDALSGHRLASNGKVFYNDTNLYNAIDLFRSTIGYVPQQDIVHRKISIRHALEYTARLRLPPDTSQDEIDRYLARVLDRVGLTDKADFPIDTPTPLSGGQLKRVSLAVELVANPKILFLDEVTSGLDAGTDKKMMHLFRDLAADHKTIVCVTHTLENIDACHLVVLLHQGKLVYFGPPQEVTNYFGIQRLSDVYDLLESKSAEHWQERFRDSSYFRTYVIARQAEMQHAEQPQPLQTSPVRVSKWRFDWSQTTTLMRRYLDLIFADRRNLVILLLQAPVIAAIIGLVFRVEANESTIVFTLVLSAIWFGGLNSARELVKELPIYLRERAVNLRIGPYLASKLLPLTVLCAIQCILLLAMLALFVTLSGNALERFWVLFSAGLAATAMGLAVSAFVDSNDKAAALVPILLIPQVVLANAIVRLDDLGKLVAKATMISFWAYDAMKATLRPAADNLRLTPIIVEGAYWRDLVAIAILGLVFLIMALLGLKLKDRKK